MELLNARNIVRANQREDIDVLHPLSRGRGFHRGSGAFNRKR